MRAYILYRFRNTLKIANFFMPHLYFTPQLRLILSELAAMFNVRKLRCWVTGWLKRLMIMFRRCVSQITSVTDKRNYRSIQYALQ